MEQEHDKAEGEELSQLEKDANMMISDLDKLPSAGEEEMAESRRTFEKIYDKILSSKTESFKPGLVRENDFAKSYLGYPHKVLEVLKEEGVDRIRAEFLFTIFRSLSYSNSHCLLSPRTSVHSLIYQLL